MNIESAEKYRDALERARIQAAESGFANLTIDDKTMGRYSLRDIDAALGRVRSELAMEIRAQSGCNPLVYNIPLKY